MLQSCSSGATVGAVRASDEGDATMRKSTLIGFSISLSIAVLAASVEISAQDKYTVKVPNGLAFSEFRGYEG